MKFPKKNRKINQRTFRNKPNPPKMVNRIIASINRKIETNFFFSNDDFRNVECENILIFTLPCVKEKKN